MKKFFMSAFALVVASCFFFSCADLNVESNSSAESIRKQELALLAATGGYVLSEDVMKDSLLSFLTASDTESRSVISANSYEFTLADETTVSYPEVRLERSIAPESINSLSLYLYEFSNKDNESSGFAITSTDERIGSVLAVVPEGNLEDGENDFLAFYTECLENYIEETVDLWNEIDDEYIRAVCKEARVTVNSERSGTAQETILYENGEWTYKYGNNSRVLRTAWGQSDTYVSEIKYNTAIKAVYKKAYLTGCATTAIAQILAYYKPPMIMYPVCLEALNRKWDKTSGWDGTYNWQIMTENPSIAYLSESGQVQVAALMYEIAERLGAKYGTNGTSAKHSRYGSLFSSLGFANDGLSSYSYNKVKNSIDKYGPLLARGASKKTNHYIKIFGKKTKVSTSYSGGHAWVIDEYANLSCINKKSGEVIEASKDFVHCNVGWQGNCDGYYLSGVFDMNSGGYVKDSSIGRDAANVEDFYQYEVRIVPDIHFNGVYEPVNFGVAYEADEDE
ncbi:MAG: C10 family peptidase [Treponema sp.]|nr:C10 family peptidase [Treponema sp.]